MKKTLLTLVISLHFIFLNAQETVNIFRSNLYVSNLKTTNIDSIKFGSNHSKFELFKNASIFENYDIVNIDSITFSNGIPNGLPVLNNPQVSRILNSTAVCSFTVNSTGGTSVIEKGICWSLNENPTVNNNKVVSTSLLAASEINLTGLTPQTSYFVRAYAINSAGINYSNQIQFTTNNFTVPTVKTLSANYNASTNKINCVVNISANGGCSLTERGICWSTKPNPTIADSKFSSGITVGQFYGLISDVNINNKYYIRGFATNCIGTAYGEELTVQVLMGNITYSIQAGLETSQPANYKLIKQAMDSACWYYNRYTNFRGNIYVYYNEGIPTAQASFRGSIGFGPNTTYMWVGTAMHEIAHFVGSGTTWQWQSKLSNGVWTGAVASALLKSWTGEVLKGDNNSNPIHFWPYGINYRSEITNLGSIANQQLALMRHCLLVKAMVVDDAGISNSW